MPNPTLIPRRILFGNASALGAEISPDGRWLSWIAPFEGVLNIWVAPAGATKLAEPVTRTKGRPIWFQQWSGDGRFILFRNDETGDENFHVFATDPVSKELRDLTPLKGINAQLDTPSHLMPDKIAVGLNDRDVRWHDIYLINLATGERELIWQNTQQFSDIGLDPEFKPRYASNSVPGGGAKFWRLEGNEVRPWLDIGYEDALATRPYMFDAAGKRLLMSSSLGRNTAALHWLDWQSGTESLVAEHPRYDVGRLIVSRVTREVLAASVAFPRQQWVYVAPAIAADMALLSQRLAGLEFGVQSETDDGRKWVVSSHSAEQPATYYLYDRDAQSITELFSSRPDLKPYRLAPMHPVEAKSRDGLDLLSYLTLPASLGGAKPDKPLPMVLDVHGGPWGADTYVFRGDHQWLADRGYAVLSVNYRASWGFGKAFAAAGEKEHARKMHDDLIDMVDWAVREGIADKDKIAITGGSYGGYASFVGATFTPEVFCCSVPVVGITNLETLLNTIPPYWAGFAEFMYRSYGDPRTEEGRALLRERSPIHKVDRITKPMLIFHGANDVRCKIAEADQIVDAMQARAIPVTYVVYPDEGHGFHKPENRLSYIAMAEAFFARILGGALEPMGDDLKGSSHEIRAGADLLAVLGTN